MNKQPEKHIQKVLSLFRKQYESFELCDLVSKSDYDRLSRFITTAILDERKRIVRELEGEKIPKGGKNFEKSSSMHHVYNKALSDAQEVVKKAGDTV